MITRRRWIAGALLTVGATAFDRGLAAALVADFGSLTSKIAGLEKSSGGRLGVAVLDTASGARFSYRAAERFPMCSTFKLLAVGAVLTRVDRGKESLGRIVHYVQQDVLEYAPVTRLHVDTGMSVGALCEAAITWSDNTAANLLLNTIGGPAGVTAFARKLGDGITRLDRNEPTLNEALPGDPRDTSSPLAMLTDLRTLALGNALAPGSRARLVAWLVANKTGDQRLRAGLPAKWRVGDKTGSGRRGTTNDLAIVWPDGRAPLLVSVYLNGANGDDNARNATIAAVSKQVVAVVA